MQVLDDIWASIKGNAKSRISDPIIGTFVVSWVLCNWDRLALLIWGAGKLEARINKMSKEMAFINEPSLIWNNYDLLILPAVLTIVYIFFLPMLAHKIEKVVKPTQIRRHDHTVDLDIDKAIKQKKLNKAHLRANPYNEFLAQEVKIDIEREREELELTRAKAEAAKNMQIESKAKATAAEIELEKVELKAERDARTLAISTAKQKAQLASHRFPSAYLFIHLLSNSLKDDDVVMSLHGLTRCVATIFGYDDFNALLNDKQFNNENLDLMKYILLDTDRLAPDFYEILEDENIEEFDSEWLISHLEMVFEHLPYALVYPETLAERVRDEIDENRFELLDHDGVIGGMAETDTIFDEVDEIVKDNFEYDMKSHVFVVSLSGTASGSHRKESDIPGQSVDLSIEARCGAIVGCYGLSDYEISASATPTDYSDRQFSIMT
ncbi:hypothetical protein FE810_08400 [Thalassotalea litorea]|uniref:Uncharacterized protein n=1 Tax=Thalassotalea litorea TaxID=2020715 RepID=A0A5R9IPV2_9GAMM|nr:hypothetical protein [Thalassotalea litorea]TLU65301.1 hypothetical protein FE810_08400 [Thalassotalea litorea]